MKKSGSLIFLMELIVVLLFFSLSVVVTLRLFITANNKTQQSSYINTALTETQNVVEQFRVKGISVFSPDIWTERHTDDGRSVYNYENTEESLFIEVSLTSDKLPGGIMYTGDVRAYEINKTDEELCVLELARYSADTEVQGRN